MDVGAPAYGADDTGLICGYLFREGEAASPIDAERAAAWARAGADGPDGTAFVWLHFNLSHNAAERWLVERGGLPDAFFETLKDDTRSTRIERADDALIAVINDVHFDFSFEPSDLSTLWVSVDHRLMVTARRQPLRSVDKLREAVRGGATFRSTVELLEHLMRDQADVLVEIVRNVTARIDRIEDQLLAGMLDTKRAKLGALRRLLVRLQRLLAPEPASLFRLLQHPPAWMAERDAQELRQATEEFSVVLRDMSALQERIKLLQEEVAGQVNEQNNRSLFVLTVVTVLALPINMVAGLLGMNVGGIPLADHRHGFWVIVGLVAGLTGVLGWFAFRKSRDD
jgi:zinc transporter